MKEEFAKNLDLLCRQLFDEAVLKLSCDKTVTKEASKEHFGRVPKITITTNEYGEYVHNFNYTKIGDKENE